MSIARREFLKIVGGATVAGGVTAYGSSALAASGDLPAFGFDDNSVPMNAANLCPMPVSVSEAHGRYAAELDRSLSTATRRRIEAMKEDARSRVAALLGTSADEIAIVRNTSEANNVIVQGVPIGAGDEVVLWDQNHPSNSVAWDVQAARVGASVRRFSVPVETASIDEVVERFVAAVSGSTAVVSFTHISNITGFRTPAAEICAAIRHKKPDVHIHVDGAQTWGAVDFDLGTVDCDSFSGSAHKWFMGPREVGLLYVREGRIDGIWPNVVSVPWGRGIDDAPAGARRFDALGQRDDAAVASLADAAAFHEAMTPKGVEQRSMAIADRLRAGLEDMGVRFVSPLNPLFASSVVILRTAGDRGGELVGRIYDESGIQGASVGGLRLSPHVYNTDAHVDRVIDAIRKSRDFLA